MKLLIADDEWQIRTGLKEGIDWNKIGIDEVFIAADGIEARQIFDKELPSIVITDIRMPGMDGLDLSKEIRKISSLVKVIILSGYSEFEYARKALQFGISDYLLKPVKINELIKIVAEARDEIIEKSEKIKEEERQKFIYGGKLLEDILSGSITDRRLIADSLKKYMEFYGNGDLGCFVLEIDNCRTIMGNMDSSRKTVLYENIKNSIINHLADKGNIIVHQKGINRFVVVYTVRKFLNNESFQSELCNLYNQINKMLKEEYKITVSCGVGGKGTMESLKDIYQKAIQSLGHKLYMGEEVIIFYDKISVGDGGKYFSSINENELKENIARFDYEAASNIMREEFRRLKELKCADRNSVKDLCIDMKNILVRTIKEKGIDFEKLFGNNLHFFDDLESYETIEGYKKWLLDVYYIVITGLSDMRDIRHNSLMLKAAEYIKINYYRDLKVEEVADYVKKNPNYFSHLFKKEFGISFSEYINKVRINEAKKLMKSTSFLAYEIAERVGFQDYKYFTQVFKKLEGYTPSEIRKGKVESIN